jgi:hypothetical protein
LPAVFYWPKGSDLKVLALLKFQSIGFFGKIKKAKPLLALKGIPQHDI